MKKNVLIIGFLRPREIENLIQKFLSLGFSVFVSLDGITKGNKEKLEAAKKCREVIFRFQEKVTFRVYEKNLGCRKHVTDAINWFFASVDEGLIVEDDIDVLSDFNSYIEDVYEELSNNNVFSICLFNPAPGGKNNCKVSHWNPWGWYTNKTKWELMSPYIERTDLRVRLRSTTRMKRFGVYSFCRRNIKRTNSGQLDTWDIQVHLKLIENRMTCIFPYTPLSRHIGYDRVSSHAGNFDWWDKLFQPDNREYIRSKFVRERTLRNDRKYENAWQMTTRSAIKTLFPRVLLKAYEAWKRSHA